eukprot:jgi/Bigna1/76879/fgenesh1_pg.44_\
MSTATSFHKVSFKGVLDAQKLENLFNRMFQKIEEQDGIIRELRHGLTSANAWRQAFDSMDVTTRTGFQKLSRAISKIEARLSVLESSIPLTRAHSMEIKACREEVRQKADMEVVEQINRKVTDTFEGKLKSLRSSFTSTHEIAKLEKYHDSLRQQMVAIESMINCKVDKSLLPVLEGSVEKLDTFTTTQQRIDAEIKVLSKRLSTSESIYKSLSSEKEDKLTMVKRMQALDKRMNDKLDQKELEGKIVKMNEMISSNFEQLKLGEIQPMFERMVQTQEKLQLQLKEVSTSINLESKASSAAHNKIFSELETLHSRTTHQSSDISKALTQESRLKILEEQSGTNTKMQSAYISDLIRQMKEVKLSQNQFSQQLHVAMRFVNWFTDVKLAATNIGESINDLAYVTLPKQHLDLTATRKYDFDPSGDVTIRMMHKLDRWSY